MRAKPRGKASHIIKSCKNLKNYPVSLNNACILRDASRHIAEEVNDNIFCNNLLS